MDKATAEKILMINCQEDKEGRKKLFNNLQKTKWFAGKELTMLNMQKVYELVSEKYGIYFGTFTRSKNSYSVAISKHSKNEKDNYYRYNWIDTVYAYDLEELMVKALLLMYFYTVKGIKFRDVSGGAANE